MLRTNGKFAKIQEKMVNGEKYSFIVDMNRKKATLAKILNKKDYKKIAKSLNDSRSTK